MYVVFGGGLGNSFLEVSIGPQGGQKMLADGCEVGPQKGVEVSGKGGDRIDRILRRAAQSRRKDRDAILLERARRLNGRLVAAEARRLLAVR